MTTESPTDLTQLLEHAGWVRGLVASLACDPNDAADVTQEVWRATLAASGRVVSKPRPWLGGAVRNAAMMRRRGEGRRDRREHAAARSPVTPFTT